MFRRDPSAPLLSVMIMSLLLILTTGAKAWSQTQIHSVSTDVITIGDVVEVTGQDFGPGLPKAWLAGPDGKKVKGTALRVLKTSTDSALDIEVRKAVEGQFDLIVKAKGKGRLAVPAPSQLGVAGPTIVGFADDNMGFPKNDVSMTVENAGAKKRKVSVMGKNAKIVSITALEGGDLSTVVFRVPSNVPNGTWDVRYSNDVGSDTVKGALTVAGSKAKIGKFALKAQITGRKKFNAAGKKLSVNTSLNGPTMVIGDTGGKNARRLAITFPFVLNEDLAPEQYTEEPAMIHYVEHKNGETVFELESQSGDFTIQISAIDGDKIAGSFCATLYPVTGGTDPQEIEGTFIYDGAYDLAPSGGVTNTMIAKGEVAPRVDVQILSISGATGPTGNFQPGDKVKVRFRLPRDDGASWMLSEMSRGSGAISGPTFNYQRVVASQSDPHMVSTDNGDGTYTYTFPPLPETYLAPYNDTPSFGPDDGELTGEDLLDGTYTVGLWFEWTYSVNGVNYGRVGSTTRDILVGASVTEIVPREVVLNENCNSCHGELEFHGGHRITTEICALCHTAGAEDRNVPSAAGGTPGATIAWNVMIHKIHNGAHLPSVNGVSTVTDEMDPDYGKRDYSVEPKPYQLVGFGNTVHTYDHVVFPAWPNLDHPMPKDLGYGDLDDDAQDKEDAIRSGVTSCNLCHGDHDGDGKAPLQGDNAYDLMRRNTCGSCHDDWIPEHPYIQNTNGMPQILNDATCAQCHPASGSALSPRDGHLHPLLDDSFTTGLRLEIAGVSEGGMPGFDNDDDGTLDPGEKMELSLFLRDQYGSMVDFSELDGANLAVFGPSWNQNTILAQQGIPASALTGEQPVTVIPTMPVFFEIVNQVEGGVPAFNTKFAPHRLDAGSTTVYADGGLVNDPPDMTTNSTLAAAVVPPVNYLDVQPGDGTKFARKDIIAIQYGEEDVEYLLVQNVIGDRLWFSSPHTEALPFGGPAVSPGPVLAHDAGAAVGLVVLDQLVEDDDYELTAESGTISEVGGSFPPGADIVVSYDTDFVFPDSYPLPLNAGPDLNERDGVWAGKSIVDGTYAVSVWGIRNGSLTVHGESNSYREGAPGVRHDFLVGNADELEPYAQFDAASCYSCHVDIQFHGNNRQGVESCVACHTVSGAGDRPQYVAFNAPETEGVTIGFREMVHKIHTGAGLANPEDYEIVGFGSGNGNDGNNFSVHTYEEVGFPVMPSGTMSCNSCHGDGSTAWTQPLNRMHPEEALLPTRDWNVVCSSCHDSAPAVAHIESQSSPLTGAESCLVCHGPGKINPIDAAHIVR